MVFPGGEFFRPRWFSFFQAVVDGAKIALEFGDLALLLGGVDPRLGFVGVVEKSKNAEVVVVGDGIEFVRVALGALEGEAESGFADAVEPVDDGLDAKLLRDNGALFVDHAVAEKTGGDDLILGGLGQEVAGDLLDEKLVVGLVPIQGVNDPVTPGPLFAREIFFEAVAVGVAGGVEPDAGPFLAVAFAREKLGDEGFDGGRETFHGGGGGEGSDVGGRRREAGEVEEEAAAERGGIGGGGGGEAGGGEFRGDEGVDGLGCVKRGWSFDGGGEGPVGRVRGALGDPAGERVFLRGGECFFLLGRRHHFLFVGGENAGDEFAVGGLFFDDRGDAGLTALECAVAGVETKAGLAIAGVGAVAVEAIFGENGLDLAGEVDDGGGGCGAQRDG